MKKNKLVSALLVAAMTLGLLTGCGAGATEESGEAATAVKDTVVYGTTTAPAGVFLPTLVYVGTDMKVNDLVYASLLQMKPDGSLECYLADDYNVDGNTITFTLKEGVKWHDGEDVTVDDVVFTLESVAKSDNASSRVSNIAGVQDFIDGKTDSISGITTDGNTITIELSETFSPFLVQVGTYNIFPEHIWGEIPYDEWETNTELLNNPVGCGPYKMAEYNSEESVELEAYDEFFGGEPEIENFIVKVVNADAIAAEVTAGNIDFVSAKELTKTEVEELEAEGYTKYSVADETYQYLSFNLRLPIFQDKNLRQAFAYAIDREAIVENIVEGRGVVVHTPLSPASWACADNSEINTYEHNTEKAIELLEESGWTDSDGDGIRENADGEKLQFTIKVSNDSETRVNAILYAKECLAEVGIEVEVDAREDGVICEETLANHDYELLALNAYYGDDPDPYFYWHSSSASDEPGEWSFNVGGYINDVVDESIIGARQTMDQEERAEYYLTMSQQINEDMPMLFLYAQNFEIICNPDLQGVEPGTVNILYNVSNWSYAE